MKLLFLIYFAFALVCDTESFPNPINKIIRQKIETIRKQMPCGVADGPVLVPFKYDEQIELNGSELGLE